MYIKTIRYTPANIISVLLIALFLGACSSSTAAGTSPTTTPSASPSVPQHYQNLYTTLNSEIGQFANTNSQVSHTTTTKPIFGAHLLIANGNTGTALLNPQIMDAVKLNLNRFQELGIQGVTITLSFPLLVPSFPQSARYLTFYQNVAHEVRIRHMTLAIEQNMVFTNTAYSSIQFDYSQYTFQQYIAADHQMAQLILDKIAPDYLAILGEPDTYAENTGFRQLATVQGATTFAKGVIQGLNKGKTLIGAGTGTWLNPNYARSIVTVPGLDFLSIHVYEMDPQFIQNTFTMADIAHQAGKRVVMDEAWLYKTTSAELQSLGQGIARSTIIYQRDAYSFWQPLDAAFLAQVVRFAQKEGLDYVSPFWTTNFFAYLNYSPSRENQTYTQQRKELNQLAFQNMSQDSFSSTGSAYRDEIRQALKS